MILDWPDEIGTLPPEALQNNPQIGDYTHAATCDFSAKQQKRINTNENNITKLNNELTKTNESIDDIKNNWFNIETSPLWKKIDNNDLYTNKWYIVPWTYVYFDSKQLSSSVSKLTKVIIEYNLTKEQMFIVVEKIIVEDNINITLSFDFNTKNFIVQTSSTKYKGWLDNNKLYQYIGNGTPIEFIAAENTERDYYTKIETNDLLDKKQDKLIQGENITIDENNKISATSSGNVDENRIFNNKEDKNTTTDLINKVIKKGIKTLTYRDNPSVTDDLDIPNKKYVDDKLEDTKSLFPIAFSMNAIGQEIPNLETTNKTVVSAINELKNKDFNLTIDKLKPFFSDEIFVIQEKINEVLEEKVFKINPIFILNLLKSASIKELQTYNKTIVDAVNELHKRVWILEGDFVKLSNELHEDEKKMINNGNWKEVGTKVNINHIKYTFKSNTKYKIYYNFESQFSNKKFAFICKEFLYGELNTDVQTLDWDNINGRIMLSLQMQNDTIAIVSDPSRFGQLLKLEELQE
ncbi:hypothetical protein [Spiroplasma endosymbiont of Apeira syringaria]|uniref:hypothetical protein n=1 Tax=Spiroplasma endosymbiont of Apeira syringaria TaxID=3066307 RepID=UPI0030D43439